MSSTGAGASDSSLDVERKRKMSSVSVAARKKRHVVPANEEDEENGDEAVNNDPESRTSSTEKATAASLDLKPEQESVNDSEHDVLTSVFKDVYELLTCKICIKLLYEPYTLSCGHTYCYRCLSTWLTPAKTTCPDCRTEITEQPAPAYLVRELVRQLVLKDELLANDDTKIQNMFWQREDAYLVEYDKSNTNPRLGGFFRGIFKPKSRATRHGPIVDVDDNVLRCPQCNWELEDGFCSRCGPIDDNDDDDLPSEEDSFGDAERDEGMSYIGDEETISSAGVSGEETDGNSLRQHRLHRLADSMSVARSSFASRYDLRDISEEAGPNIGRVLADHYGVRYETQSEDGLESDMTDEDNGSDLEDFIAADDEDDEQANDTDDYEEEGVVREHDDDDDDEHSLEDIVEGESGGQVRNADDDDSDEEASTIEQALRRHTDRVSMYGEFSPLVDPTDSDEEDSRTRSNAHERFSSSENSSLETSIVTDSTAPRANNPTAGRARRTGQRTSMGRRSGESARVRRRRIPASDEESENDRIEEQEQESEDEIVNRRQRRRVANGPR